MIKKINWKIALMLLAGLGLIIVFPLVVAFGKSGREARVLGKNYSILSKKQIEEKLQRDFPMEGELKFADGERNFSVNLASISAQIDSKETASTMLFRRLKQGLGPYISAFFQKKDFELIVQVNEADLEKVIEEIAIQVDKPYIPAEIGGSQKLAVKEGQIGRSLQKERLREIVMSRLSHYELSRVSDLPLEVIGRIPTSEEKKNALERATKLVGKQVKFVDREADISVDDKTLISWVSFFGGAEEGRVGEYVTNLGKSLKREPEDAVFKFENGKVLEFRPDRPGYYLDEEQLKDIILRNFLSWESSNGKIISEALPLIKSEAKIKTGEVNNMGIKELLGKGTSTFHHSSEVRNVNIKRGAAAVNQVLVAPKEEFSFVKSLGEVSRERGYTVAYIIRGGRTELDVGGGICQVSTTLFRAMLDAGVNITQRRPHAYRVSYYEEDSPPGYDATVFIPNPDLRFVNDTGNYLLIQSIFDGVNKKLTYEIYGTSDGRRSEISNYKQWGAAAAPPDVWIDDPNLPTGKIVKEESRVPGLNTSFDWRVSRNGEVIHQQSFVSKYTPWAAVYRRGTGQ